MKLLLELPDPKFKVGDFVRFTRNHDSEGFDVTVLIETIYGEGSWRFSNGKIVCDDYHLLYQTSVQRGLTIKKTVIRPGIVLCPEVDELDFYGELVEWYGTVVEGDNKDNIEKRWKQ